ncbi:MAG TPA: hypothetical protein PLY26_01060 [Ferruginibacter sp.]|nr:hypothetical protein [Ferruginibacter sp.]
MLAEEDERRRRIKASVAYRVEESGTIGVGDEQRMPSMQEPATRGQRGYLYKLGVPWKDTERITKRQASGWIGRLINEQKQQEGVAG